MSVEFVILKDVRVVTLISIISAAPILGDVVST